MLPASNIGKLGFQRWFQRELIVCHTWLAACLLCAFAMLALVEDLSLRRFEWALVPPLVESFVAGAIAWYALTRYLYMLMRALRVAERSICARCGANGDYRLVGATPSAMTVACRKCGNEWTIG